MKVNPILILTAAAIGLFLMAQPEPSAEATANFSGPVELKRTNCQCTKCECIIGSQEAYRTILSRLESIETQLLSSQESQAEAEIVEPPSEPEETTALEIKVGGELVVEPDYKLAELNAESEFYRWILDNYEGTWYYHNGESPAISHLVSTHGLDEATLESMSLSDNERAKIHGATHTNTMEKLRDAYAGIDRMNGQASGALTRVTRQYGANGRQYSVQTPQRVSQGSTGGYWRQRCNGNSCWREWVSF